MQYSEPRECKNNPDPESKVGFEQGGSRTLRERSLLSMVHDFLIPTVYGSSPLHRQQACRVLTLRKATHL